jgi:hypothetical protein
MKTKLKRVFLILTSLVIYIVSLPLAFAKSASNGARSFFSDGDSVESNESVPAEVESARRSVYDSLRLDIAGLSREAFEFASRGYGKLMAQGRLENDSIITIADFSQPSNKKRLYVVDIKNYKVIFNTLVAHGKNTGDAWARKFSNTNSSHQSSPGFYVTEGTYMGSNGYSLRLQGMEPGINDRAMERAIVMHGADYVSYDRVRAGTMMGRSWGCPAVPRAEAKPIIDKIKHGSMLFIYTTQGSYASVSRLI